MGGHHQVFLKIGVGINQGQVQVPPLRKLLTTQEVGIFICTHQHMIKNYVHHKTPAGAIVVPKQPPAGERKVGDWTFHYNGWWPSDFDRDTYVRASAKREDSKPLDRMGCLDVDVLKKHGLRAKRVKNDPLFFFTLLFPSNVYTSMSDSGSGMGHEWNPI